jgi:hypothetical protein
MKLTNFEIVEGDTGPEILFTEPPSAEMLDLLIVQLGKKRASTLPPVGLQPPAMNEQVEMHPTPKMIAAAALSGEPMLGIRHPGFGWLHFRLDEGGRQFLVQHMTRLGHIQPPTPH